MTQRDINIKHFESLHCDCSLSLIELVYDKQFKM